MTPSCGWCGARPSALEHFDDPRRFYCGACGFVFVLDWAGQVIDVAPSQHTSVGKPAGTKATAVVLQKSKMEMALLSNPRRRVDP